MICPVRTLSCYLQVTNKHRRGRHGLILPVNVKSNKSVAANTISWMVKKLISYCHCHITVEDRQLFQILDGEPQTFRAAHEVRAISSSLAWKFTSPLQKVMASCYWRHHSVFTDFYLRDVTALSKDKLVLSSRVAAD